MCEFIENNYGEKLYTLIKNDHIKLLEEIQSHNKMAVRIIAKIS